MTDMNKELLQQAKSASHVDHTKVSDGGGALIPEEGKCKARLVGYIEYGVQPREYNGEAQDPCPVARLVFECFGKKNTSTREVDGVKKKTGRVQRSFDIPIKLHKKAKFYKLFNDMDYGRGNTNMAQMLDDVFILDIGHNKSQGGGKYSVIKSISSPLVDKYEDGESVGKEDVSPTTPPSSVPLQLFMFDAPTMKQWESIYIDGTHTVKEKNLETGKDEEVEKSNNFIQNRIMEAENWEGSPMQALLMSMDEVEDKPKSKKKADSKAKEEAPGLDEPVDLDELLD